MEKVKCPSRQVGRKGGSWEKDRSAKKVPKRRECRDGKYDERRLEVGGGGSAKGRVKGGQKNRR